MNYFFRFIFVFGLILLGLIFFRFFALIGGFVVLLFIVGFLTKLILEEQDNKKIGYEQKKNKKGDIK